MFPSFLFVFLVKIRVKGVRTVKATVFSKGWGVEFTFCECVVSVIGFSAQKMDAGGIKRNDYQKENTISKYQDQRLDAANKKDSPD